MRISDWSSDVCSSDLQLSFGNAAGWTPAAILAAAGSGIRPEPLNTGIISLYCSCYVLIFDGTAPILPASWMQFGRSEERRVGKECVIRVDLGGRRIIKKKKINVIEP